MKADVLSWRDRPKRPAKDPVKKRRYDVKVSCNKGGNANGKENKPVIRFGFINRAGIEFDRASFIRFTSVVDVPDRIYFVVSEERESYEWYTLSKSQGDNAASCFSFTPTDAEEKIIRTKWLGEYELLFDEECQLYYIALANNKKKLEETD